MYAWLEAQSEALGRRDESSGHPVVVATHDLARGLTLGPDDVQVVLFPERSRPEGALQSVESSIGRIVLEPIRSSEPILDVKLGPTEVTASPIALRTALRKRAYPVRLQGPVGTILTSGDRIDLLVTIRPANADSDHTLAEPTSRIVVENVLALEVLRPAAPQGTEGTTGSPSPSSDDYADIILEVTPEEAERVALAEQEGTLRAVLRHPTDADRASTTGITQSQLLGIEPQMRQLAVAPASRPSQKPSTKDTMVSSPPAQQPVASKEPFRIEVLRGGHRSEIAF